MDVEMRFDICDETSQALTRMIAGARIIDIAKGALDRVGPGTIGRRGEHGNTGVLGQPLGDGLRLMKRVVIDDIEPLVWWSWIGGRQGLSQVPKQPMGFVRPRH
jgi:hypothetical protein